MTRRAFGKEHVWPTIVIVALASNVALGVTLSRLASRGANLTVEPDYYRKAVQWDSTLAQERRSAALGWQVTPSLGALRDARGGELALTLRDATGAPVTDAGVRVEARQVAHADEVLVAVLASDGPGVYRARLPMQRAGLWEVRLSVARGDDRFASVVRFDASRSADAVVISERPGAASAARLAAGRRKERAGP